MLNEYSDVITHMKQNEAANAHFLTIFEKHSELEEQIEKGMNGDLPLTDMEKEALKKKKLQLKDEAYTAIVKYKQEHGL
jgi:uncharacterized protein YdcH (DUF465 family)